MTAVFRLPFSEEFLWLNHQNQGKELAKFTAFDNEEKTISFLAESFEILDASKLEEKLSETSINKEFYGDIAIPSYEEYLEKIEKAIAVIRENSLEKIVISRPVLKEIPNINIKETYLNLTRKFQNTLCYLLISEDGVWMGASPEILGKFDKKNQSFFTMSLAGTLPVEEDWSEKEIEEQRYVTHYISDILGRFSTQTKVSETYDHISGNVKHLRTDFTANIDEKNLETLIADLHPTPAVCGIPKDFCKEKILEIEDYDRQLYAGYIKIETEEYTYFFVNIRCAKVFKNHIVAFSGGGITAKSNPEKEWQETELKSQAVLGQIG